MNVAAKTSEWTIYVLIALTFAILAAGLAHKGRCHDPDDHNFSAAHAAPQ